MSNFKAAINALSVIAHALKVHFLCYESDESLIIQAFISQDPRALKFSNIDHSIFTGLLTLFS